MIQLPLPGFSWLDSIAASPRWRRMKSFVQEAGEPLALHYRVNAGFSRRITG